MAKNKAAQLSPGRVGEADMIVDECHTALHMGSGRLPVLATPAMVALMEAAAQQAVDAALSSEMLTIGTYLEVHHYGATPVGAHVVAVAELTAVDGRTLTFQIRAYEGKELIGEGVHRRALTSIAGFNRLLRQKTALSECGNS
jgi:fluoroacetyl-CoA thioesterase